VVTPDSVNAWLGRRWLVYLGAVSYPVYLLHEPVVWCLTPICQRFAVGLPLALLLFLATCALVIPLSALTHRFVEQPFITWGKKLALARMS
jgi:peptidoglycan/LPS O-acetylase OafA/YrhL